MSLSYSIAQIIAPAVTGWLALHLGSYRDGLYLTAVVMVVGTLLFVLLRVVEGRAREGIEARPS